MNAPADLLTRLIAAGTPAGLVAEVALALGRAEAVREEAEALRRADEARREKLRKANAERQRGFRDRTRNAPSRVTAVTGRDEALVTPGHAAAPPIENILTPPSPTDIAIATSVPPAGADDGSADRKVRGNRPAPPPHKPRKRAVGSRIADDWTPPPVDQLPLEVQVLVRQWPSGGYEMTALAFHSHWLSEGRAIGAKRDWPRTWVKWIIGENTAMIRAKRAGATFVGGGGTSSSPEAAEKARLEGQAFEALQQREHDEVRAFRKRLRGEIGERTYDGWLRPTFIRLEQGGTDDDWREVTVCAGSQFMLDWIREHFAERLAAGLREALGIPVQLLWERTLNDTS